MKLKSIHIENFRCYQNPIDIEFDDLTTFIGKNDIGKSSILEALEIFFNNDIVKIDITDANIYGGKNVIISCDFTDLPEQIILDSGEVTNLKDEYLLTDLNTLRIKKVYDCSKLKVSSVVYIEAVHPTLDGYPNLLSLKEKELQNIIKDKGIECKLKGNPLMRKAIYNNAGDLKFDLIDIEVSKTKEDAKEIWSKLESYLPNFALFQCDRNSQDSDGEVQNPMKIAIQEAISELNDEISAIERKVELQVTKIANNTKDALNDIDTNLAGELTPKFTLPTPAKWNSLFSISMDTDKGISLNKRGSGVRRMILVAFFKAEAERKAGTSNKKDIIYAIEEPETAQHPNNQRILINSFVNLSHNERCQVILTTHSPNLANELPIESLRFIDRDENQIPVIREGEDILPLIVETLGILPDVRKTVQLILCVEGPTDVEAFKCFSRCLREKYKDVVDLEKDERILIVPLGGSILKYWVEKEYLKNLHCPEVHIYDNDVKTYQKIIEEVNSRGNGSWGTLTNKYEIENYLSRQSIMNVYNIDIDTTKEGVPKLFGIEYSKKKSLDAPMKDNAAKRHLTKAFREGMNIVELESVDPDGEVKGWFDKISSLLK